MTPDPDWPQHCGDDWRARVLAATGRDICDVVGPSPRRPREWVAMMRRLNVRSLSGVVCAVHGPARASLRLARRGDIARAGWALGECRGEVSVFFGGRAIATRDVDEVWPVTGWAIRDRV